MGKVILCAGKRAEKPYTLSSIGATAESMEELCFNLRQNLDIVDSGAIDRNLASFIKDDLGLPERGKKLESLISSRASLKEKLLAVFESCDYYDDVELNRITAEIDELSKMSGIERKKKHADRQMHQGHLIEAAHEYRSILSGSGVNELSEGGLAEILHNLGIFEIHRGDTEEALRLFLEAYEHNGNRATLKAYLFALKLTKNNSRYADEVKRLEVDPKLYNEIESGMHSVEEDFEQSNNYSEINRMKVLWQQGRFSEEKRLSGEIIDRMKHVYRKENEEDLV